MSRLASLLVPVHSTEQQLKARLLEVVVETKHFGDGLVPHHGHADAVGHSPVLVGSVLEERPRSLFEFCIGLHDGDVPHGLQSLSELYGSLPMLNTAESVTALDQNERCRHEFSLGLNESPPNLFCAAMPMIVVIDECQQSGCVEEYGTHGLRNPNR